MSRTVAVTHDHGEGGLLSRPEVSTQSGLCGVAECMPVFHQFLGLAEHLGPVLQLSASGIHVGAYHHPAQLEAPCRGGRAVSFSGAQKPHHLRHPQCPVSFSASHLSHSFLPSKEIASPLPLGASADSPQRDPDFALELEMAGFGGRACRGAISSGEEPDIQGHPLCPSSSCWAILSLSHFGAKGPGAPPSFISPLIHLWEHSTKLSPSHCHSGEGSSSLGDQPALLPWTVTVDSRIWGSMRELLG